MKSRGWLCAAATMLALSGCATFPLPWETDPSLIGTLQVDGTEAFLNGGRVPGGTRVHVGDTVTTGANTSVKLQFVGGGYLQLDENTDPRLLREGGCILVQIFKGQALVDAKRLCIEAADVALVLNSRVNIRLAGGAAEVTLLEGSATVTQPSSATLVPYDQYRTVRGRSRQLRLSSTEALATARWTERYFRVQEFRPPVIPVMPPRPPPPPPG